MIGPDIRFQTLQLDPGGETALVWAKKKCRELAALGLRAFGRKWPLGDFEITAHGARFSDGHYIARLWVKGGIGTALFDWPSDFLHARTALVQRILMGSDPVTPNTPAADRINAVGLAPLGTTLSFSVIPNFVNAIDTPLATLGGLTTQLERMVRNGDWFARPLFQWLLGGNVTFTWQGRVLEVHPADCFISPWSNGDFKLLIGAFPSKDEAAQNSLITPSKVALYDHTFNGVIVSWSALKGVLTAISQTNFDANLDKVSNTVIQVTGYTRKDIYGGGGLLENVGDVAELSLQLANSSPFAAVYMKDSVRLVAKPDPTVGGVEQINRVLSFTAHTLLPTGVIETRDLSSDMVIGSSEAFLPASGAGFVTATVLDLAFFSGERFVKYGSRSFTGGSNSNVLSYVDRSVAPIPGFDQSAVSIAGYVREYDVGIALDASAGPVTFQASGPVAYTANGITVADEGGAWLGVPSLTSVEVVLSPPGDVDLRITGFGLGPFLGNAPRSIESGLPDFPGFSGVYWHRDGPLGVLIFATSGDLQARADDVQKYRNVFLNVPGYRLMTVGGIKVPENGWEDPGEILARIVARTNVILNNFASPSLYPWIDPEFIGVILDP